MIKKKLTGRWRPVEVRDMRARGAFRPAALRLGIGFLVACWVGQWAAPAQAVTLTLKPRR